MLEPAMLAQAVAALGDTVRVVDTIQTLDTVWVVQSNRGWVDTVTAWSTGAVAVLALVAIGVEVRREFARSRERAAEAAVRRAAVDARISAVAYALRRELTSWLADTPDAVDAVVQLHTGTLQGAALTGFLPPADMHVVAQWAADRSSRTAVQPAEHQLLQLLGDAPDASPAVAEAIRRAYVVFYRAVDRLSRQQPRYDRTRDIDEPGIAMACQDLQACASALEPAIGSELRQVEATLHAEQQHPEG